MTLGAVRHWWRTQSQVTRSLLAGGPLAVVGILLVWISTFDVGLVAQSVLANIGTALLTTAVLGMMYEGFIKDALIRDVQISSGLSQNLINSGLKQVHSSLSGVNLLETFADSTVLQVVPNDPLSWGDKHLEWIIELASKRALKVIIYLPQAHAYSQAISTLPGLDIDASLRSEQYCAARSRKIRRTWDHHKKRINEKSSLQVMEYEGYPHTGLIRSENLIMVLTQTTSGSANSIGILSALYDLRRSEAMRAWVDGALEELPNKTLIEDVDTDSEPDPSEILPFAAETQYSNSLSELKGGLDDGR